MMQSLPVLRLPTTSNCNVPLTGSYEAPSSSPTAALCHGGSYEGEVYPRCETMPYCRVEKLNRLRSVVFPHRESPNKEETTAMPTPEPITRDVAFFNMCTATPEVIGDEVSRRFFNTLWHLSPHLAQEPTIAASPYRDVFTCALRVMETQRPIG
jgi:hypothetical protein